jgi:DNA-binding CsgD family transcriptional regulator
VTSRSSWRDRRWSGRGSYHESLALQLPLARASRPSWNEPLAIAALGGAAVAAYCLGEDDYRAEVTGAARQLAGGGASAATRSAVLLALTACAPFLDRDERTAQLGEVLGPTNRSDDDMVAGADPRLAGTAAWLLDESELAVEALGRYRDRLAGWTGRGLSGGPVAALAAACLDTGRWSRAGHLAGRVLATEMLDQPESSIVAAQTVLAFLAAQRGDASTAARLAAAAEESAAPWSDRAALTRARHAAALGALNAAEDDAAYELLSDRGGGPLHYHRASYAVADFALAAVRTGRGARGGRVLASARRRLGGSPSPRVELLIRHAEALLSTRDEEAERHFRAALAPGGSQWPIEQAGTALHYAEWLRRRRREKEAVPLLISARRSFELVGAEPAVARANEELRAARHSQAVPNEGGADLYAIAAAWSRMSAHQRRILRLAAFGRSNREIAAEHSLSPRTVGSHLYRAFPALGISSRHQIRDVLARLDSAAAPGPDQRSS